MRLLLSLLLLSFSALGEEVKSFQIGEELSHELTVCVFKQSAIDIVKTDAKDGFEAAKKVWLEKDDCDLLPVVGPSVGRVVFSAQVLRSGKKSTASVVEIIRDGKAVAYFITSKPVVAKLEAMDGGKT